MSKKYIIDQCNECPLFYQGQCRVLERTVNPESIDEKCPLDDDPGYCREKTPEEEEYEREINEAFSGLRTKK